VALVAVIRLELEMLLEKVLPVHRQHPLDQIEHAKLHGLHSTLLRYCLLHELVSDAGVVESWAVLKGTLTGVCRGDLPSFAFFLMAILDFGLFAVEVDDHNLAGVSVSIVKVQLNAEVALHLGGCRSYRLYLSIIAAPWLHIRRDTVATPWDRNNPIGCQHQENFSMHSSRCRFLPTKNY